jgi:threonine synthase
MGLPVKRFIAGTNSNDVFTKFITTGKFVPTTSVTTLSNAMDVGNPSNYVRIVHLFEGDITSMREALFSASFSDDETRNCIAEVYAEHNYVLDPHGAVGMLALNSFREKEKSSAYGIVLETAHPAKFPEAYSDEVRKAIEVPERLRQSLQGKKQSVRLSSRFQDLKTFLLES